MSSKEKGLPSKRFSVGTYVIAHVVQGNPFFLLVLFIIFSLPIKKENVLTHAISWTIC